MSSTWTIYSLFLADYTSRSVISNSLCYQSFSQPCNVILVKRTPILFQTIKLKSSVKLWQPHLKSDKLIKETDNKDIVNRSMEFPSKECRPHSKFIIWILLQLLPLNNTFFQKLIIDTKILSFVQFYKIIFY